MNLTGGLDATSRLSFPWQGGRTYLGDTGRVLFITKKLYNIELFLSPEYHKKCAKRMAVHSQNTH